MPPALSPLKATTQLIIIDDESESMEEVEEEKKEGRSELNEDEDSTSETPPEQVIGLNDSGMYPLGTVIIKQFDEGLFTGKIVSYALIDDDSYPHYHVLYEDGDREDLSLSEIEVLLKAAAEKANATKEPTKKKRKIAEAPPKKAAKANSGNKPAAVQKTRLTPPRKARDSKRTVAADLEDSDSDAETESNMQAFARQHYGKDTEGIRSAGKTPPNQKTQSMVITPSPSKVEVQCPICREFLTTCTQKDDAPLPLTTDGIADWNRCWPKGTENPKREARIHFVREHLPDGILPNRIETPLGIRFKNKKRDIAKLPDETYDFPAYAKVRNGEKKLRR
jgi:hypothetical protein